MEDRIYDYWVATLQDGYLGDIVNMVSAAGGARAFYALSVAGLVRKCKINERLAGYTEENRPDIRSVEENYYRMQERGIHYVNHTDNDFPEKLRNILGRP